MTEFSGQVIASQIFMNLSLSSVSIDCWRVNAVGVAAVVAIGQG
jgi:hypothetical protein